MEHGIEASLVLINVRQVLFALNIKQVSYQMYAYMPINFFFFKNPKPPPIQHFLNVNAHLHFITNYFLILNIHNWIQLEENNNVRFLYKVWINDIFIPRVGCIRLAALGLGKPITCCLCVAKTKYE